MFQEGHFPVNGGKQDKNSLYMTTITGATYYSVKEGMLEAFANGDSLFGVNHEALANQIFGIL
jgi:YHS domain-containing protein